VTSRRNWPAYSTQLCQAENAIWRKANEKITLYSLLGIIGVYVPIIYGEVTGTSSNSTEVNILSGASGLKTFITQTGTGLHETSAAYFYFALTDYNDDKKWDIVVIKKNGTSTKTSNCTSCPARWDYNSSFCRQELA
jgi:hypothetical protein